MRVLGKDRGEKSMLNLSEVISDKETNMQQRSIVPSRRWWDGVEVLKGHKFYEMRGLAMGDRR